jgi:hypothetical protein
MIPIDLKNMLTFATGLKSQAVATTTNGPWVDIRDYVGNITAVLNVAAATAGTNPTMDVKVQDATASDGTGSADITGYTFTQVTTTDSLQQLNIDTRKSRRYVRLVFTIGGTSSPSFPCAAVLVGQKQLQ